MRVVFLVTRAEHGGAQLHVRDLLAGMPDVVPVLGVGEEGFLTASARSMGIPVSVLPALINEIRPLRDIQALAQTLRFLRRTRPDLVHAHSSKAGIIGRIAARMLGIPCVFTAHGWAFAEGVSQQRRRFAVMSEKLVAPLARTIITVSEADRNLALRYGVGRPEQLRVIHNGVPDLTLPPEVDDQHGERRPEPSRDRYRTGEPVKVVMVARFAPPKDQSAVLRAVAGLSVPLRVVFVGDGPTLPTAQAEARALGLEEQVGFLGSRDDVPEILSQGDALVLTSAWEGFPLSVLEGMRAGLPVVASDVGGVREAVQDGITGFLIPRGDTETLAARLEQLARDAGLRSAMGQAGRLRFEQHFTSRGMLQATHAVYREAVARRGG